MDRSKVGLKRSFEVRKGHLRRDGPRPMLKVIWLVVSPTVPLELHRVKRFCLKDRADQRVHLGHVAAEPEQPAAGGGDDQTNLDDRFVGTSGHKDGQEDANHPPDGREDGHGEDRGPHDDALL